jgi:predicted Zn-dependent protease
MKKFIHVLLLVAAAAIFLSAPCAAQGCKHWMETLAKSFFPRQVDEQGLRAFTSLSPQEYFQVVSQKEETALAPQNTVASQDIEARLQEGLGRFYQVGSELYGVRLNSQNVAVAPDASVNAFASGSHIFVHEGLLHYFLRPADYVGRLVSAQTGELTAEQYQAVQANFAWQDDWDSIYFVLAHEAAHNLMRHRDARLLGRVLKTYGDYRQAVLDHRKDVADGRAGAGVKRYLWQSMQNFAEEFESAEHTRGQEAEADAVALVLLQRSGFNPYIGLTATQRMDMLFGDAGEGGWQAGMTEVLCSTHPDWMVRIQKTESNLNCLQFKGNLCENHITYPVENVLKQLREGMKQLDEYNEETSKIAEAAPSSSAQLFEAEIKVEPKDAQLRVDGQPAPPGVFRLPAGPHALYVTKDGYSPTELRIVVFPDVKPKVNVKLKKLKG